MNQKFSSLPVPHLMRESVIAGDGFLHRLRERGWSVAGVRPIYTDAQVIRQPWIVCPNGARSSDRTFYHLFGITRFRKLLRAALSCTPCPTATFASLCSDSSELHTYLTFLRDQEFLYIEGDVWNRGARFFQMRDIGHTLEWYVAEWFRFTQTHYSHHLIPVRHGVTFQRMFDMGDIDVVALLDSWIVTIECQSSSKISDAEFALFLRRARLLRPAIAVLLIDTPALSLAGRIHNLNALLAEKQEGFLMLTPFSEGIYWGAETICVTTVSESLPASLEAVLQVIKQNVKPFTS